MEDDSIPILFSLNLDLFKILNPNIIRLYPNHPLYYSQTEINKHIKMSWFPDPT